jgi:thiaminase (transcriptional activator TenA)
MTRPGDPATADSMFARLKASCPEEWGAYVQHEFVRRLSAGTLPEACFRHFLVQDYLFLIHFARAWGLAAFKADRLDDIRGAAAALTGIVDVEMDLHVDFCRNWGLSEAEMAAAPEAMQTTAYTRYVMERGMAGDLLDLHVALAPCIAGYGEIGRALAEDPETAVEDNPYRAWIEMYAGTEYQEVAAGAVATLDRLAAARGGEARYRDLALTFAHATRLETAFWEMGMSAAADSAPAT